MFNHKKVEYIKAISPVHAGTGQDLGIVDMPIQRETHTGFPKIEGSSLKGAIKFHIYNKIRDYSKEAEEDIKNSRKFNEFYEMLGYEDDDKNSNNNDEKGASRLAFTDAKLLFFPVKAVDRLFYYVTCPYILKRWHEEVGNGGSFNYRGKLGEGEYIAFNNNKDKIILEEYIFEKHSNSNLNFADVITEEGLKEILNENNTIIVSDEDFKDLVTMYTEMITRNKIDPETGVAENTGLFTEEYLPSESIMYYMVLGSPKFKEDNPEKNIKKNNGEEAIEYYQSNIANVFQVGGNKTIGKGLVKRLGVAEQGGGQNGE
ncbi:type III-B CRISPR module RAMP protein Cmr4 [Orenia metallireducens]|uniref:Type III-B CRISPR module RAMP protein Cmr4 n=1 Tax=Orenia metallireducens TaxID=1413210 RepID=A0A1C0A8F3_9FIRM|nr:type III-B CRISPR module RAMP protein Cmr4 [Orenia metallireducens]OCL26491.1 type III-B CRISPR module RAMP protein Cmr4 [Orenia metallireducens]